MKHKLYQQWPLTYVLEQALTAEECQSFINLSLSHTYEAATITVAKNKFEMREDVRNNQRLIYDDEQLAQSLFLRFEANLPATIDQWRLKGLNERFRYYRYTAGQMFKPHIDGWYERSPTEQSFFTFLIYLNDEFEGGETIFYQRYRSVNNGLEEKFKVTPKQGDVLIFDHKQLHEGASVITGCKYVLRTDVMYCLAED